MNTLPETGFLRLPQIIGDKRATPPIPALVPIGKSAWWAGVKDGRYPRGIKLSPRVTVWTVASIRELIASATDSVAEPAAPRRTPEAETA
jgi:predicted DNA-binding transcriptional regulator AlpA